MDKKYFFSIIIPTRNPNKIFLHECLSSVASQTYKEFELVIVANNCNPDDLSYIYACAKDFKRFSLIESTEVGVSRARNKGIECCKGDYIIFLDDDDVLASHFLESAKNVLNEYKDLLIFSCSNNRELLSSEINNHYCIDLDKNNINELFYGFDNKYGIETRSVWGKVFASKIIKDKSIKFCPTLFNGEDTCFVLDYVSYCNSISFLPEVGYYYRTNLQSITYKFNPDIVNQFDIYYEEYKKVLLRKNKNIHKLNYVLINQIIYNIFISYIFHKQNNVSLLLKAREVRKIFQNAKYKVALKDVKICELYGHKKRFITLLFKCHFFIIASLLLNRRYSK